jgi:glycosyltransferase involved in cell wall biosynthesis
MHTLVLWSHHSGYLHGCLQQLSRYSRVTAVFFEPALEAPYSKNILSDSDYDIIWISPSDTTSLAEALFRINCLDIDLCLVSSWHHRFYMNSVLKLLQKCSVKVLCHDWQWEPSFRNYAKALYGSVYRSRIFDACFVPGERQYQFAQRAGFPNCAIYQGLYAANPDDISCQPWHQRSDSIAFVGRLVESKGCKVLASSWYELQSKSLLPPTWYLEVFGVGPYVSLFQGLPKCNLHGFVQPQQIGIALSKAKILCAPSLFEPWGLQIHEATIAGLAILATHACGSAVHLVRSMYNGDIVASANALHLATSIHKLVNLDLPQVDLLKVYGTRSRMLSTQYSPEIWAETAMSIFSNHRVSANTKI